MVTAHLFGANAVMDAFNIAFTIPNTLRRFVAEGALTVAFIPVYTEVLRTDGLEEAKKFYRSVLGLLLITLTLLVLVGILGASYWVYAFASGFAKHAGQLELATSLTRWMFVYVFFISFVALAMGALNSHKHFSTPAFSPVLLNVSMVGCSIYFYTAFQQPIYSLALGVILGGILQLAAQLPTLARYGLLLKPSFQFHSKPLEKLLRMLLPSVFGVAIYQINLMVLRQLGSYLPEGQITCYSTADRIMQLALGIFAISIATATLPAMSEQSQDHAKLLQTWNFSTRLTNFITIPASIGLTTIGLPIVSVLFFHGAYDWQATELTAWATIAFAPGLITVAFCRTTVQAFYALQDMRTPVLVATVVLLVNFALGVLLMPYEVVGLAGSLTLSSFIQAFLLAFFLKRKIGLLGGRVLIRSMLQQMILSAFMGAIAYGICSWGSWQEGPTLKNSAILGLALTSSIGFYAAATLFSRMEEASLIQAIFLKKLKK